MKKRFLSLATVLCLTLTLAPAAAAASTNDLQTLINNTPDGGTITLEQDYTLGQTLTISDGITINGAGHTITYQGGGSAIVVKDNAPVTLNELNITATAANGDALMLTGTAPQLTLDGCTLTVNRRGINILPGGSANSGVVSEDGASLQITNSDILNSRLPAGKSYENWACNADTRGLSITDFKNASVDIDNSEIKGFAYCINTNAHNDAPGLQNAYNTEITVSDSEIWGWSAFNIWTCNTNFEITDSHLRGINNTSSGQNDFSTIRLYDDIYGGKDANANVFDIYGGLVEAVSYGSSREFLFCLDNTGITEFNFDMGSDDFVVLNCSDTSLSAFMSVYPGMSGAQWAAWYSEKLTGADVISSNVPLVTGINGVLKEA